MSVLAVVGFYVRAAIDGDVRVAVSASVDGWPPFEIMYVEPRQEIYYCVCYFFSLHQNVLIWFYLVDLGVVE